MLQILKKIILLILILLSFPVVLGSICQDIIYDGEECQLVTPILSCVNTSFQIFDSSGVLIQSGNMIYFTNQTYYMNFQQGEGEYLVKLSCDDWTREIYVIEKGKEDSGMMYPSFFGVILLFLVIIGISIFLYFYNRDDAWLQGISLILGISTFIFLIVISISVNEVQMGYQSGFSRITVGDTDYNSNNVSYYNVSDSRRYLLQFNDFNDIDVEKFESAELCFKYNNSDASNSVAVYSSNGKLSQNYYINANSIGESCIDFKASKLYNGVYLGILCNDCLTTNPIGLAMDLDATNTTLNIANQTNYVLSYNKPFIYESRVRYPPFNDIRSWFFRYVWFLGFIVLLFGARMVIMVISKTREVMQDE